MSKDPAFLFYPGDYLRDTQMLSEKTQVAYDRIMCEHMRNICITQQQLNFLTKRLSEDEKTELMMILDVVDGGYQISWVAESITKRKAYSESRRKNREGKQQKDMSNISETYDEHMENEIENENINKKEVKEDLPSRIIKLFQDCFLETRGDEYIITNKGKERSAAGKLIAIYKKKNPEQNTEEMIEGMRGYFNKCLEVQDQWLFNNMSLSIIHSKLNELNTIIRNENQGRTAKGGVTDRQLAEITARMFDIEY